MTIYPKAFWKSESNNKTTHIELRHLYLYNNNITYIKSSTFDQLINLEIIYLESNKLSNTDNTFIVNLNKLVFFSIASNELEQLTTKWLPNSLQRLYINENAIEYMSIYTFEGAFNLNKIWLSPNNITIEYNTFSNLTKLTYIGVDPDDLEICTCKYIWYINTKSNSKVCDNSNNNYSSIREYLIYFKEEFEENIPG